MENETQNSPSVAENVTSSPIATDVAATTEDLVAKHRKPRKDKGQSRGPRKSRIEEEANASLPPAVLTPVDLEIIRKSVSAIVGACSDGMTRSILKRSKRIGADNDLADELAATVQITIDERHAASDCIASIFQKYQLLGRFAPEAMLCFLSIEIGLRYVTVSRKLSQLENEIKKRDAAKSSAN